jgi:hypothetical protein
MTHHPSVWERYRHTLLYVLVMACAITLASVAQRFM